MEVDFKAVYHSCSMQICQLVIHSLPTGEVEVHIDLEAIMVWYVFVGRVREDSGE